MPRDFAYRGFTLSQLQAMSMDEFITILPSRQRRTLHRGLKTEQRTLLEKIRESLEEGTSATVKTHVRNMVILPEMVGATIEVHNGKEFVGVPLKPEMIGHSLGEFAITNKPVRHGTPGIGASRSSMYVPLK